MTIPAFSAALSSSRRVFSSVTFAMYKVSGAMMASTTPLFLLIQEVAEDMALMPAVLVLVSFSSIG